MIFVDSNIPMYLIGSAHPHKAEAQILGPFRHRNLNEEVEAFRECVPTTENMASEVDLRLRRVWCDVFPGASLRLEKVRIWETERNICEISE